MMYFINARMTVGPVELNPINITNEPESAFICTVQIDRGSEKMDYQHFYGSRPEESQSKAELFANALGNCRVLQKIQDVLQSENVIKVDELLTLIKTADRWN